MKKSPPRVRNNRNAASLLVILLFTAAIPGSFALSDLNQNRGTNLVTPKSGAQIECTTPDGQVIEVPSANAGEKNAAARQTGEESLSCPLQEGRTTFVIKLPETTVLDQFAFVNENAAAAGELRISVSNYQLPAASTEWVEVNGNITFSHKRLFNVSMVGVEARYLKLSFNVAKEGRLASLGGDGSPVADKSASHQSDHLQFGSNSDFPGAGERLKVTAINPYGNVAMATWTSLKAPAVFASNSTGTVYPGGGAHDLSSSLGTLAVPPVIPVLSP